MASPLTQLLRQAPLWAWGEPGGPPRAPGACAWFSGRLPPEIPPAGLLVRQGRRLLAVGIAPRAAGGAGRDRLRTSLAPRITGDFTGPAHASALRMALGVVLAASLQLRLTVDAAGARFTWGEEGEAALSAWMQAQLRVSWLPHPRPWEIADMAFRTQTLPLNLNAQDPSPFQRELARRQARLQAEARPAPAG